MNISRVMATLNLKDLEKAFVKAKQEDPSKGTTYQKARKAYTDLLKKDINEKNRVEYLDKRIQILQEEKKLEEIFDSRLGKKDEKGIGSELLEFAPFQETEQEEKEKGGDASKNVYDLFVKFPPATIASGGTKTPEKKQGVYEGILNKSEIDSSKDDSKFEEPAKADASAPPYSDNASFLSPFALYKVWMEGEENSYTLLRSLLSFLGDEKLKELDTILVKQFDEYDKGDTPSGKTSERETKGKTSKPDGAIGQDSKGNWYYAIAEVTNTATGRKETKVAYDKELLTEKIERAKRGISIYSITPKDKDGPKYLPVFERDKSNGNITYGYSKRGTPQTVNPINPHRGRFSGAGGRRTPRRHLKREGRKTKKLPRASP